VTDLFLRTPQLDGSNEASMRLTLAAYFHDTFSRYESLFRTLTCDEAYYKKPISLRHPLIFYFGHTATFFINKLLLAGLISERINPAFESMFSVGVDEMSWDDLNESHYDWPTVAELAAYRDQVRAVIDQVIRTAPLTLPVNWNNPWWAIIMGIEHERIHLETSSVLMRQHALNFVQPLPELTPCTTSGTAPENTLVTVPAGITQLGKPLSTPTYGWDNEYAGRTADVTEFQASRHLVSNAEFREFVDAGGYQNDTVWEDEGCGWRDFAKATHPTFWVRAGDAWKLRLMAEEIAMPWDWPAEVNYHEAKAFCHWKAATTGQKVRLPTEDEWYRLYDVAGVAEVPESKRAAANIHLDHFASPCPGQYVCAWRFL
jgi:5-histidylcysteine sulfoxide synthase